ncbi:TPA: hypothetical protein ACX13S_003462 [Citrobacter koseri]
MNNKLTGLGANHPANGPLTTERLIHIRDVLQRHLKYSNGGSMDYIIADAVKAIDELLVGRKAEPIADVVAWASPNEERTCDIRWRRHDVAPGPLYTTPPAPVVMRRYIFEKWWESQNGAAPRTGWDSLRTTDGYCDDGIDGQFDAWNACHAAMLQAGNSPVIPDGYCIMPVSLTVENGAKRALSGEFSTTREVTCPECDGDGCSDCDGRGDWNEDQIIDWPTIKLIYQKAVEVCAVPTWQKLIPTTSNDI